MKRISVIIFSLLFLISMASCKQNSEIKLSEKITVVNGNYYIKSDTPGNLNSSNSNITVESSELALNFQFKTLEEMIIKLRSADFTKEEFKKMEKQYPKDKNGILIPNLDNIKEPSYIPEDFVFVNILWGGGNDYAIGIGPVNYKREKSMQRNIQIRFYSNDTSFKNEMRGITGVGSTDSLDSFIKSKVKLCKNFTEKSIMREHTEGKIYEFENKDGYKGKAVRWDFEFQGKKYYVQENYAFDYLYEEYSNDIGFKLDPKFPYNTVVFVEDNDNNFSIKFNYLNMEITKDFIAKFGLKNYTTYS